MCTMNLVKETSFYEIEKTRFALFRCLEKVIGNSGNIYLSYYKNGKVIICQERKRYYLFDREKGFL